MYATPSNEGVGALGGQRVGEKDLELYLLGKKRVDEVLKAGEQNVSTLTPLKLSLRFCCNDASSRSYSHARTLLFRSEQPPPPSKPFKTQTLPSI